jgi:hypothetical protein
LKSIEDLITLYDQPPPKDSQSDRKQEVIRLQNAKASTVSDAVKEVYRDLLSANDKALTSGNPQQREQPRRDWFFGGSSDDKGEQKVPRFKGLLSIGVDDASNTLVVSAPGFLFDPVRKMIMALDEAAAPETAVRVVKVGEGISAERLQTVLESVLGAGASTHTKSTATPQRDSSRQFNRRSQGRSGQGQQGEGGNRQSGGAAQ